MPCQSLPVIRLRPEGLVPTSPTSPSSSAATSPASLGVPLPPAPVAIPPRAGSPTPAAAAAEGAPAYPLEQKEVKQQLEHFFAQEWVQSASPELLFIKRATRATE